MASKLNKHTPTSDELLKRLETNDSAGLDDFEKEALEGFASLENPELARSLQNKLDARISEEYSQKKSGNRTFFYLSMAAGLILIVGLTVIFYNSINSNKAELALSETSEQKESVPNQLAPVEELKKEADKTTIAEESASAVAEKPSEKDAALERKSNSTGEGESKPTDVSTKSTSSTGGGVSLDDMVLANKQQEANNGPVTAAVPPAPSEDQKPYRRDENLSEKEALVQPVVAAEKKEEGLKARSTVGGLKKKSKDSEYKNAPGKAPASELTASSPKMAGDEVSGKADMDNASAVSQPVFMQKPYDNAQAYIKSEIDKNANLKSNVKEFKAKLSIDENGKITKVKFLNTFTNCSNCEKDLESILLKMPNWKPAQKGGKAIKETLHFVYP